MSTEEFDQVFEDAISAPICPSHDLPQDPCRQFRVQFEELLDAQNSSGRLIFVFIQRILNQFRLSGVCTPSYVLNGCYLRGVKLTSEGVPIQNVPAWLRSTGYNFIREIYRDVQKSAPFEGDIPANEEYLIPEEELDDDLVAVREAFDLLDEEDARLLNLQVVEELSWKEIRQILHSEGWGDLKEATLRKRKERALIKLRKQFHALRPYDF